jgi:hypothetical protein
MVKVWTRVFFAQSIGTSEWSFEYCLLGRNLKFQVKNKFYLMNDKLIKNHSQNKSQKIKTDSEVLSLIILHAPTPPAQNERVSES